MTDIKLNINGYKLFLKMRLDKETLKECNFKKLGFIGKLLMKYRREEKIYYIKNPLIMCLDKFGLCPLEGSNAEMYGTSGYLFYSENHLSKVFFQIIGNKKYSKALARYFATIVTENFGEPNLVGNEIKQWDLKDSIVTCETMAVSNSSFYWTAKI